MLQRMENNDYQKFAEEVREKLNSDRSWEKLYSDYASDLLTHRGDYIEARRTFRMLGPFDCYLSIGEAAREKAVKSFNLRYLGQSVADINCAKGAVTLNVVNHSGKNQVDNSEKFFDYHCGELKAEPWNGEKAKNFRKHFSGLSDNELPRQKEHLFESKLYSELEKKQSGDGETKKTLCGIQPITYIGATRFHMKTALKACDSKSGHCELANNNSGGEIDMFCRLRR